MGAQYKLNNAFELTFVPTMRFALSSINKDAPVKTNESSFGLAGGVMLIFDPSKCYFIWQNASIASTYFSLCFFRYYFAA